MFNGKTFLNLWFKMQRGPLFLFDTRSTFDRVVQCCAMTEMSAAPRQVRGCQVFDFVLPPECITVLVSACVMHANPASAMDQLRRLMETFDGDIFVYNRTMGPAARDMDARVRINAPPSIFVRELGMRIGEQALDRLARYLLPYTDGGSLRGLPIFRSILQAANDARLRNGMSSMFDSDDGGGDDPNIAEAIRRSQVTREQEEDAMRNVRMELPPAWENVLRASEPSVPGQPECVVCRANRASICFVGCNHQTACDDCVRTIWSRVDVPHACPLCREPCVRIVRPILGRVSEEEEEEPPTVRKRSRRRNSKTPAPTPSKKGKTKKKKTKTKK